MAETDYDVYVMTVSERWGFVAFAAVAIFVVAYIFYHSVVLALIFLPLALLYPKIKMKDIIKKRKNILNLQFKDMLYSLSSSVSAGKSVEMAFSDALKDLSIIYPDHDSYIISETEYIVGKIAMNCTVEAALRDFADRARLEDVSNFVDVFATCKRTGGNMVEIIRNTANIINEKIETKQEIDVVLAEKAFEQKVLSILPVVLIVILSTASGDYMQPVFERPIGKVVMTVSVGLLVLAYYLSKKVMDIKI